jgi:hypothetical protein
MDQAVNSGLLPTPAPAINKSTDNGDKADRG